MTQAQSSRDITAQLHRLISLAADGRQGYEVAAQSVSDPAVKNLFRGFSRERAEYLLDLQHLDVLEGEAAPVTGGALGALHRTWLDMKSGFTSGDTEAIVNACITGEEAALREYRSALSEPFITGQIHTLIREQEQGIRQALNCIQTLADRLRRAAVANAAELSPTA